MGSTTGKGGEEARAYDRSLGRVWSGGLLEQGRELRLRGAGCSGRMVCGWPDFAPYPLLKSLTAAPRATCPTRRAGADRREHSGGGARVPHPHGAGSQAGGRPAFGAGAWGLVVAGLVVAGVTRQLGTFFLVLRAKRAGEHPIMRPRNPHPLTFPLRGGTCGTCDLTHIAPGLPLPGDPGGRPLPAGPRHHVQEGSRGGAVPVAVRAAAAAGGQAHPPAGGGRQGQRP